MASLKQDEQMEALGVERLHALEAERAKATAFAQLHFFQVKTV